MTSKRLIKELKMFDQSGEFYRVKLMNENLFHWEASICGPVQSPYEGGIFHLDIRIPLTYPIDPPKIRFKTKIYHPNIHLTGEICLDILKSAWSSTWSIEKVLWAILSLLTDGNAHDPFNARAASFYREKREKFDKIAQFWTKKYARTKTSR